MDFIDPKGAAPLNPLGPNRPSAPAVPLGGPGPLGWWRIMDVSVGIVPLPIFFALLALIAGFVWLGKVPADLTTNIAVLTVGGFGCAELGKHLPGLRRIGA